MKFAPIIVFAGFLLTGCSKPDSGGGHPRPSVGKAAPQAPVIRQPPRPADLITVSAGADIRTVTCEGTLVTEYAKGGEIGRTRWTFLYRVDPAHLRWCQMKSARCDWEPIARTEGDYFILRDGTRDRNSYTIRVDKQGRSVLYFHGFILPDTGQGVTENALTTCTRMGEGASAPAARGAEHPAPSNGPNATPATGAATTPPPGSPQRAAIMEAMRPRAEQIAHQPVVFRVVSLRVTGDHAHAVVVPLGRDGQPSRPYGQPFTLQADLDRTGAGWTLGSMSEVTGDE